MKPRKPESRKPSKKKLQKMEQRRKAEERLNQILEEQERTTRPFSGHKAAIEECRQRLKYGKLCYCKEACSCRSCQENQRADGCVICDPETLREMGCHCINCPECDPCF